MAPTHGVNLKRRVPTSLPMRGVDFLHPAHFWALTPSLNPPSVRYSCILVLPRGPLLTSPASLPSIANMRTGIHLLCNSQHPIPAYKYIVVSRNLAFAIPVLRCWISHCANFLCVAAAMATSAVGALALCAPEVGASQPCSSCASSRRQWNAGTSIGRRGLVSSVKSTRANCGVRAQVASSPVKNAMEYKKLGDSDLVISEVTLGTVRSSSVEFFLKKIYLFIYFFRWSESARVEWEHHKHLNSYIEFAFTLKQSHQTTSTLSLCLLNIYRVAGLIFTGWLAGIQEGLITKFWLHLWILILHWFNQHQQGIHTYQT